MNSISYFFSQVSCQWEFFNFFLIIPFPISSRWCSIKNSRFKSLFKNIEKKGEIKSNFLNTPSGGSNWITIWFNMVFTQWFNLGSSVSVVKKLLSSSPYVTKVLFMALKLILSNSLCMITWLKFVFSEITLCKYCFIYTCALFCHFCWVHFPQKRILFKKTRF